MNMLEKAIVSVRGTDIEPVLRCEVNMGFGAELQGSVPADYMTCDEEEVRGGAPLGNRFVLLLVVCLGVCVCFSVLLCFVSPHHDARISLFLSNCLCRRGEHAATRVEYDAKKYVP